MVPACSLGDVLSGGCFCVRFTHLHKFSRIYTNFSHFPAKFVYLCICVCVFVFSGTLHCYHSGGGNKSGRLSPSRVVTTACTGNILQ